MAISDVQKALIAVGTISRNDVATVAYDTTNNVATSQASWLGSRQFVNYTGVSFIANPGDTTGTTVQFGLTFKNGNPTVYSIGTIVSYTQEYVMILSVGTYYMVASNGSLSAGDSALYPISGFGTSGTYTAPPSVCFVEGTRIRTERGEIAVEDLVEGDAVVVLENGAERTRPVIWIGHRDVNLVTHPDPYQAQPIRFRRDALAKGVPCRDLLVSPDHAMFVKNALIPTGVLVPARLLVNGMTIYRETRLGRVRYYHVELDRHAVLFAENAPSESYLDTGNRSFFQNSGCVVDLYPTFGAKEPEVTRDTHSCAPFIYAAKSVLPIWERFAGRAHELGLGIPELTTTEDPDPRLLVDGREFRPVRSVGTTYSFMLPSRPALVRLLSRTARPCETRPWLDDTRLLGVSVSRIRVRQGQDVEDLPLDGPALGRGWWRIEREGVDMTRWTKGDAVLRLPEGDGCSRVLELTLRGGMIYPVEAARSGRELDHTARIA